MFASGTGHTYKYMQALPAAPTARTSDIGHPRQLGQLADTYHIISSFYILCHGTGTVLANYPLPVARCPTKFKYTSTNTSTSTPRKGPGRGAVCVMPVIIINSIVLLRAHTVCIRSVGHIYRVFGAATPCGTFCPTFL